jgi:hypothetical protein
MQVGPFMHLYLTARPSTFELTPVMREYVEKRLTRNLNEARQRQIAESRHEKAEMQLQEAIDDGVPSVTAGG